jgi:hypothetical protein
MLSAGPPKSGINKRNSKACSTARGLDALSDFLVQIIEWASATLRLRVAFILSIAGCRFEK